MSSLQKGASLPSLGAKTAKKQPAKGGKKDPVKVASERPRNKYAKFLKNKNVELIEPTKEASKKVSMMVLADTGSGKSFATSTIPTPNDGRRCYIAFDKACHESLIDAYGSQEELEKRRIETYEVTEPQPDKNFPGFNLNEPWTAEYAAAVAFGLVERFKKEGDVDVIVLDNFEAAEGNLGKALAYNDAGAEWGVKIDFGHWDVRASFLKRIVEEAIVATNHAVVVTGYPDEEKWEDEPYINSKGEEKVKKVKVIKPARWSAKVKNNLLNKFYARHSEEKDEDGTKRTRYTIEVLDSRNNRLFPQGHTVDVTRTADSEGGFGVFWENAGKWDGLPDPEEGGGDDE